MKPEYWSTACDQLSMIDPIMKTLIEQYAPLTLVSRGDAFQTLARSIVGQQISVKAADAIWKRFHERASQSGSLTPKSVLQTASSDEAGAFAGCGLSQRKQEYLLDLANRFEQGILRHTEWPRMNDDEVIKEITTVRGLGRWSAEMFLIFNLMRPNIFPVLDLGLQKAISIHYPDDSPYTRQRLLALAERWNPWRTVATWHLWRSLDPVAVEY